MDLKFCPVCGERLLEKTHPTDGPTLWCDACGDWRFPLFCTAVTAAVFNPALTRLLLIWQYGEPDPVFPAGYVDKGETTEAAVCRELREELGLSAERPRYVSSRYYTPSETLMLHFFVTVPETAPAPNFEVDAWRWVSPEEADRLIRGGLARELLDDTLAAIRNKP